MTVKRPRNIKTNTLFDGTSSWGMGAWEESWDQAVKVEVMMLAYCAEAKKNNELRKPGADPAFVGHWSGKPLREKNERVWCIEAIDNVKSNRRTTAQTILPTMARSAKRRNNYAPIQGDAPAMCTGAEEASLGRKNA